MEFIESNQKIQAACQAIADTLLWNIENKKIYDLEEFEESQAVYRDIVKEKLRLTHTRIVDILTSLFEIFKNDGKDVFYQWVKYVEKIDYMVEESLRVAVKRSLQEIAKSINGEGKNRDGAAEIHPLFKVNVVLESQKVDFNPTLQRLEETVNKVAHDMMSSIDVVNRLAEILIPDYAGTNPRLYDVIAGEDDVAKNFLSIQNGMINNASKCQSYLRTFDSYREIWEINKDAFIRRYAKLKPALSTFDADINRYNEVANNTQKEETLTNINFVRLDCSPLKHALVSHCSSWQNKLTTLLNSIASTDLNNLHEMFAKRSEKLRAPPNDLDQLSESLALLSQLQNDVIYNIYDLILTDVFFNSKASSIEAQFGPIREQYQILEKYEVPIKDTEKQQLETLQESWVAMQQTMVEAEKQLQDSKQKFKSDLLTSVDDFAKSMTVLRDDFTTKGPFNASFGSDKALRFISEYRVTIQSALTQESNLKKGLAVFKLEQPSSKEIMQISSELDFLQQMWQFEQEWMSVWDNWRIKPFLSLDAAEMEESVQRYF